MSVDKQLAKIRFEDVLKKRELDQALNVKEFAVLAGVSYSKARNLFHVPGFPALRGLVFWQDFVHWRLVRGEARGEQSAPPSIGMPSTNAFSVSSKLPPRAARILREARRGKACEIQKN